ncbi:MAG: hypothetical protein FJ005_03480 [Chloroflexi bacterium]|jgi:hypothetical protein|nr:hypothetical protein [Chloroflexota bacterium]
MRLIKGLIMAIGVIGVMVIIALIIGYYLYSLSPPIQAKVIPVAVSADASQSFDQKLDALKGQIKAAVDAGEKKQVSLVITEKEINSKLVQMLAEGELPSLKRVLINFGDGYFLTYAVVDTPGIDAKTGSMGRVEIIEGEPKVVIDEFNLGKLPLPKSVNRRVEQLLNIMVNLQLPDVSLDITGVEIKNHQLTVTGTTKTAK